MAESRLNEEQRETIKKLNQELSEEKRKVKEIKDEKIREVKAVRESEQTKYNAEKEELRQKLERQHQEDMIKKMEEEQGRHRAEVDRLMRSHAAELQAEIKKHETERKEGEERVKNEVTVKLTGELGSSHDSKMKKLTTSLFKTEEKVSELEDRIGNLQEDNANLKATIQANDKNHGKDIADLKRKSKMESQRQIEELKQKERELQEKEKDLSAMSRKFSQVKADKEKLEYKMELQRQSAAINVPPTSLTASRKDASASIGGDIVEMSTSLPPAHTKASHSELLLKNSELGYLVHTLQKEIDGLSKERTDLQKKVDVMEKEIEPLKERHQDNMMKINKLRHDITIKQKLLEKANEEKLEMENEKVATEKKLTAEHDRLKSKDKRINDLQKAKDEREKELRAVKSELEHYKDTSIDTPTKDTSTNTKTLEIQRMKRLLREKDKELNTLKDEVKRYKEDKTSRLTVSSIPSTSSSTHAASLSPSLTKKAGVADTSLASYRAIEHKKRAELEHKIEELSTQLQEKAQTSHKLVQRVDDLNSSLRRRDKQLKTLTTENHKLKSANQMLEESRERTKREQFSEWTSNRGELERAHAQINKLQQQKSALQDKVVELERQTPSPDGPVTIATTSHHHNRTLSPQPRSSLKQKSSLKQRARSVSPQPRSPEPRAPPLLQVGSLSSSQPSSRLPLPTMTSSPLPFITAPTMSYTPHVTFDEDVYIKEDFGSQWSLASSESILKEQLEQMEFDKDEVSIQYDELKKEFGKARGKYNVLRERYKSLLARSKSIHNKLQEREKERLQLEKELTRLQEETKNEFDVKREANLREKLEESAQRIAGLESILEEQFNKTGEGIEEVDIERERNRSLTENIEELLQQIEQQKETINELEETIINRGHLLKQLEVDLERSRGLLEGEKAVVASLKQQIQTLREEENKVGVPPPRLSATPASFQPKLQDCLVSMNDVTHELKRVIETNSIALSTSDTDAMEQHVEKQTHLIEQMEMKLSEANGLLNAQTPPIPVTHSYEEVDFEDTDGPLMRDTSFGNKNEKFQEWLAQFQKEKLSLKSKIEQLEERLSHGSDHVSQLQGLVIELESRLRNEQDIHISLLAERDETITSLSNQLDLSQRLKEKVTTALDDTNEAIERKNLDLIRTEMDKLERAIREMLLMDGVYSRDSTPFQSEGYRQDTPQVMMSPDVPISSPPQSVTIDEISFSLSPPLSPFKSLSPACSYPTITPSEGVPIMSHRPMGEGGGLVRREYNKPRLYVTLFDYNPQSLCSTGHPEKELDLHTGDVISVVGEMNVSGYYTAEFEGRRGLVPAAFVQEMNIDDKDAQYRLLNQTLTHSNAGSMMGSEVDMIPPLRKVASLPSSRPAPPTSFQVDSIIGTSSLTLSWTPPQLDANGQSNSCIVTGYCILCDGNSVLDIINPLTVHCTLKNIDVTKPHSLSIYTTSINRIPSLVTTLQYAGVSLCQMRALHDYDPDIDSPNSTPGVELDFEKGDIIVVYGDIRKDGFYQGEINGRYGLVPSNFLTPIDNSPQEQLSRSSRIGHKKQPTEREVVPELKGSNTPEITAKQLVRAIHGYNPRVSSPNKEPNLELEFKKGDLLIIYGEKRKDGFYNGELDGKCGLIPSNFVIEFEPQDTPSSQAATPTRQPPMADVST